MGFVFIDLKRGNSTCYFPCTPGASTHAAEKLNPGLSCSAHRLEWSRKPFRVYSGRISVRGIFTCLVACVNQARHKDRCNDLVKAIADHFQVETVPGDN